MLKKILLSSFALSTLLNAMDYGMAVDAIKKPEAIQTVSKGTDMTTTDVKNSVDSDKLTKAVMGSKEDKSKVKKIKEVHKTGKSLNLF